jgi:hypothetical protein
MSVGRSFVSNGRYLKLFGKLLSAPLSCVQALDPCRKSMTDGASDTVGLLSPPCSEADNTFFATLVGRRDGALYHLIAERLPGDVGWDWTVWRPGDACETARYGLASGVAMAIAAAQRAARNWESGPGYQ